MGAKLGLFVVPALLLAHPVTAAEFLQFPPGFKWCVATSAFQIEGNDSNTDWWDWEHLPPKCDSHGENCHCKVANCETSGLACDHWNRVDEDAALMRSLNVSQYNMTIEWARVEPAPGVWDWDAVAHYRHEIETLEQNGISPWVTLQHFTLPRWVRALGGWEWEGSAKAFGEYATFVATIIAPNVTDWVTMNEPLVYLGGGYLLGATPPGLPPNEQSSDESHSSGNAYFSGHQPTKEDFHRFIGPLRGALRAHAAAYHALHRVAATQGHEVHVGIANYVIILDPASKWNPFDRLAAKIFDKALNWTVLDAIETGRMKFSIPFMVKANEKIPGLKGTQDYIGLDYYTRNLVHLHLGLGVSIDLTVKRGAAVGDNGWEIYPEGFYRVLKKAHQRYPNKPIMIAENGIDDPTDRQRIPFIRDHLIQLHRAIQEGVPVQNYCHWSILDNFEWVDGFEPRFGLVEVNYSTEERIPRPSAAYFSKIAHDNGLEIQD